jgi:gamma-D-glutamyl-L-lysine dipeptidyl-peptidase
LALINSALFPAAKVRTQILFGEIYQVLVEQGDWLQIHSLVDRYEGWIRKNQHTPIGMEEAELWPRQKVCTSLFAPVTSAKSGGNFMIPAGSLLWFGPSGDPLIPAFSDFRIPDSKGVPPESPLLELARQFLHTPYLWGGKTALGIDCSGFTQVVFRIKGIHLMRDSHQQALQGKSIDQLEDAAPGDLIFFKDQAGNIMHVGINLGSGNIIHASGSVRIDRLTEEGIRNMETRELTHPISTIRRFF